MRRRMQGAMEIERMTTAARQEEGWLHGIARLGVVSAIVASVSVLVVSSTSQWPADPGIDERWFAGDQYLNAGWWDEGILIDPRDAFRLSIDAKEACIGTLVVAKASGVLTDDVWPQSILDPALVFASVDPSLWKALPVDAKKAIAMCVGAALGNADTTSVLIVDGDDALVHLGRMSGNQYRDL